MSVNFSKLKAAIHYICEKASTEPDRLDGDTLKGKGKQTPTVLPWISAQAKCNVACSSASTKEVWTPLQTRRRLGGYPASEHPCRNVAWRCREEEGFLNVSRKPRRIAGAAGDG
jgi:hypothetical protein